jgi:hypothetical protein
MENLIALIIVTAVGLALGFLVAKFIEFRNNVPALIKTLPLEVQKIVEDAVKFGSEFVELLDAKGELTKYIGEVLVKSRAKLDLATDFAVEYVENILKQSGLEVDIDEEEIKKLIQKYVWENPDLFPSKSEE